MQSYEAARNLFNFLTVCSWIVIGLGAIIALGGGAAGAAIGRGGNGLQMLLAAAPGVTMSIIGFYGLALVQMARAGVDSAEYGQQSLDIARKQLEISRQALEQNKKIETSYAALASQKLVPQVAEEPQDDAPSYADRAEPTTASSGSDTTPSQAAKIASYSGHTPAELPAPGPSNAPAIEQKASVTLPDVSDQISYKDGKYKVAGKLFWSRSEAEQHARSLV